MAEGDAEDSNRAVAAARRAFDGPWRGWKPFERQSLILMIADLVELSTDLNAINRIVPGILNVDVDRARALKEQDPAVKG